MAVFWSQGAHPPTKFHKMTMSSIFSLNHILNCLKMPYLLQSTFIFSEYMIVSTKITNIDIFLFIAVLVFKILKELSCQYQFLSIWKFEVLADHRKSLEDKFSLILEMFLFPFFSVLCCKRPVNMAGFSLFSLMS